MTRCLIVDSGCLDCDDLADCLTPYGFDLERTDDAAGALLACERDMPDMVMITETGPGGRAARFVRELRQRRAGDKPVVIVCMGDADPGAIGRAIWAGASEYLVRPYARTVLDDKLRQTGILKLP